MAESYQSLAYSKWKCNYQVVFIPQRGRKALYEQLGKHLGAIVHDLAEQKGCRIIEGPLLTDHVHKAVFQLGAP